MRAKYSPIDDELSIEIAAVQSALALDASASIAEQQRDAAGLLRAGEAWLKLADFLAALRDAEDKRPDKKNNEVKMGFQPHSEIEIDEDAVGVVKIEDGEIILEEEEDVRDEPEDPESGPDCARLHR